MEWSLGDEPLKKLPVQNETKNPLYSRVVTPSHILNEGVEEWKGGFHMQFEPISPVVAPGVDKIHEFGLRLDTRYGHASKDSRKGKEVPNIVKLLLCSLVSPSSSIYTPHIPLQVL